MLQILKKGQLFLFEKMSLDIKLASTQVNANLPKKWLKGYWEYDCNLLFFLEIFLLSVKS